MLCKETENLMKRRHIPNTILKLVVRIFTTVLHVRIEMQECLAEYVFQPWICVLRLVSDAANWREIGCKFSCR